MDVKRYINDDGWLSYDVQSPKMKVTWHITKAENGYSQYIVVPSKGPVPDVLSGVYTTPDFALKELLKYLDRKPKSPTTRRDENAALREERKKNGSKIQPDNSDPVQQGSPD